MPLIQLAVVQNVSLFSKLFQKGKDFDQLAVIANTDRPVAPCGSCRQVMAEFFSADTPIYMGNRTGEIEETTIGNLLPYSFTTADLRSGQEKN